MSWEYSYENHDWDMTLGASLELFSAGERNELKQSEKHYLSYYTGSMLLAFCSIESFANSLAFLIHRSGNTRLNYRKYTQKKGVWEKLEAIAIAIGMPLDRSRQPFRTLEQMRAWRNDMVHAKPFSREPIVIEDPSDALSVQSSNRSYLTEVTRRRARAFYRGASIGIARLQRASGLDPTTFVSYRRTDTGETVKIERRTIKLEGPAPRKA